MNILKDQFLTAMQASGVLGIKRTVVIRLIIQGILPGYKVGKRKWGILKSDLDAFIKAMPSTRKKPGRKPKCRSEKESQMLLQKQKEKRKIYRLANKEKCRELERKWRVENRGRVNERQRGYYAKKSIKGKDIKKGESDNV